MNRVRFVIYVIISILLILLCRHVYLSWQCRDLSHIAGRKEILETEDQVTAVRDVYEVVADAKEKQQTVRISERELNFYIAEKLRAEQRSSLGAIAKIKGVWVDLQPHSVELIIERRLDVSDLVDQVKEKAGFDFEVEPFDHTVSMRVTIVSEETEKGHRILTQVESGSVGKSPAPGYYVKVIQNSFNQILRVFQPELKIGYEEMVEIHVMDGVIELNPVRDTLTVETKGGVN